ncbi:Holliday junction resolvase RuvX [Candidatus Hepatobacter penaei]|uniref:Holliday junction resolvase RuvX n=1 Tax=Candidatus Hepatobacter penaei TaxID=1274402 RepID=UPI0004F2EEB6|nr:Holliday junction resolvase RuvX [Candidatus Hepatobacter penaei]TGW15331.1 Holliday junction resolvase RuvX [bacterium NHP-B]
MPILTCDDFAASLKEGSLLGMDVGQKTFGLAISDAGWRVASPLKTHRRTRWKVDAPALLSLCDAYHVKGVVVGWPLLMNGDESRRCHSTRHTVENILALKDYPCLLWDERLSTKASLDLLKNKADLSREKRRQVIDSVAASWILQEALDALRQRTGGL